MIERLLANSVIDDEPHPELGSPCWIFIGCITQKGYGKMAFRIAGRLVSRLAHRVAYEAFKEVKLQPDETIDHLCRVPHCINPEHMDVVSSAENTRRARAAQAAIKARRPATDA